MALTQDTITFEGAQLLFRNFSGEERTFNAKGQRNFCLKLNEQQAEELARIGLNVKWLEPRDEGDARQAYIKVNMKFGKGRPPTVVLISSRGRTQLDEDTVSMLDFVWADNIDLVIRLWDRPLDMGGPGVSAYLKSIYVKMQEDDLDLKYADIPDAAPVRQAEVDDNWSE